MADGAHGFNAWKIVKKLNLAETEKYVKALARDLNKRVDLVADILENAQSRELLSIAVKLSHLWRSKLSHFEEI